MPLFLEVTVDNNIDWKDRVSVERLPRIVLVYYFIVHNMMDRISGNEFHDEYHLLNELDLEESSAI